MSRVLPQGWEWVRLGDVCETTAITWKSNQKTEFKYIDISSVDNQTKKIVNPQTVNSENAPSRARLVVYENNVIVSTTRPNLNAVARVSKELHGQICSTGFCVLRPKLELLDSFYLFLWVQTEFFVSSLSELVKGALYPAVNDSQVFDQFIPLPPLETQQRIANLLEQQLKAVEMARAAAEAQLETARGLVGAYLKAVFETDEAKNWSSSSIEKLGDKKRGEIVQTGPFGAQLGSKDFVKFGVRVLNVGNIKFGHIDLSRTDYVDSEKAVQLEKYTIKLGDLLFTRSGSVGRCAIATKNVVGSLMSTHLLRVAFNTQMIIPEFAVYAIQGCEAVIKQVRLAAKRGSTREGVNTSGVNPKSETTQWKF
jgi:type I restriction enzyme, S subunit